MALSALKITKLSFWLLMIAAQVGGFFLFKDLADISQWLVQSSREFTMFIWYNRWLITVLTLLALFGSVLIWFKNRHIMPRGLVIGLVFICLFNGYSGMLNTLLMFRPQQFDGQALFVSVEEAPKFLQQMKHAAYEKPEFDSVDEIEMLVLESDDGARAYADYYLLQPHIVDGGEIGGKPVVMTYCGLTNMGIAYTPELKGEPLELKVMTQLRNNLVMWDMNSGEPIQQFWGAAERDGEQGTRMTEWPTLRMPFGAFKQLYPDGQVFINNIEQQSDNALVRLFDTVVRDGMMLMAVKTLQWQSDQPAFPTIHEFDDRLPIKQMVYGINVGNDYVAYTKDFVSEQGGLLNIVIGERDVILYYAAQHDSLVAFYNDSGQVISQIDIFGNSNAGTMARVETLKSRIFWFIWRDFYRQTDVNRL
ncbi:MAG: DUF3179 domain-containing (seleno)protein [Porticoccaceae bacterium]|nr:DUF3179 domain-containing (seleno)protein [Porticoccaceae bacterium]